MHTQAVESHQDGRVRHLAPEAPSATRAKCGCGTCSRCHARAANRKYYRDHYASDRRQKQEDRWDLIWREKIMDPHYYDREPIAEAHTGASSAMRLVEDAIIGRGGARRIRAARGGE